MHCSFTFLGLMARQPDFLGSKLANDVRPFFEFICAFVGHWAMLPGNIATFLLLACRATELPRWTCMLVPGVVQLVTAFAAQYAPLSIRLYLLVTIYNLSSGIWHLTMAFACRSLRPATLRKAPTLLGAKKEQQMKQQKSKVK
eukprot:TRINITY_DN11412_c0_g4_i1.p1 TRINITY_DN11412_c0_g4~~TRINITY_DN11412_c0_g4_i1.p1  ORF type:complete len:143 (+),score=17.25 TRINITY_DN11412_c0_g4_i1:468-896(+)